MLLLIFAANARSDVTTDRIESLINSGKLDQALTLTEKQLAGNSADVNYLFLKGLILTRQNKMDEAREIFVHLTEDHPELPEPYNNLAVIYAAQGDFTSARKALEQAINTHPSYATAHENLGDIYAKMASNAYNHALEIDSGNSTAREKLSLISNLFSTRAAAPPPDSAERQRLDQEKDELVRLEKNLADLTQQNDQQQQKKQELEAELTQLDQQRRQAATLARQEYETAQQQLQQTQQQAEQMKAELARLEQQRTALAQQAIAAVPATTVADQDAVKQEVLEAVKSWAANWSGKDVEGYLGCYAGDYRPPDIRSHGEWIAQRRVRLTKPSYIKVEVNNPRVDMVGPERARVNFDQNYQSDSYRDQVHKTLQLRRENGRWLIIEETSG